MTAPDPQTVREIAREYVLNDRHRAHDIGPAVLERFGPDGLTKPEYHAYCDAVRKAIALAAVTVSWPDEQQPAEHDALREQLAAATARAESATVLPERWRARLAELEAIVAEGNQRDRALALLLLRSGGKVEFTQVEQATAPSHGHLISYPNLATGGLVLAYSADGETVGAAPDGRSATETASEASGGAFQANTSSILFQGLSEPERSREADSVAIKLSDGEIRVPEDCPIPDDVLRAMNVMNDDTTEDDRG